MLTIARLRLQKDDEDGFTLIELMVVVLIIAILLAIAIPTFLGARERANDRAAQSSLRNAHTAAKTIYTDSQTYLDATVSKLNAVEPSITHQATGSGDFKQVMVNSPSASLFVAAALSKSGTCYQMSDATTSPAGTFYAKVANATQSTCVAGSAAHTGTIDAWK